MFRTLFCIATSVLLHGTSLAQFENSTRWVPETANTLVLLNVDSIFDSPLAKEQNWRSEQQSAFRSGMSALPPDVGTILVASEFDFATAQSNWEVTVFENATKSLRLPVIADARQARTDTIGGNESLVLPGGTHFVKVDDRTIVTRTPGNRQQMSRLVSAQKRYGSRLSPYLEQATQFANKNGNMIVAFDLEGLLQPTRIREKLASRSMYEGTKLDAAVEAIASIKGIMFGIGINKKVSGAFIVDFGKSPEPLAGNVKNILLEVMRGNGLLIDEVEDWATQIDGNRVRVSGNLTQTGLRRVVSLVTFPAFNSDSASDSASSVAEKSRAYFRSIESVLEEAKGRDLKSLKSYALWFERHADSIDRLSVIDVDDNLLKFGREAADKLRDLSIALRQTDAQKVYEISSAVRGRYHPRASAYSRYVQSQANRLGETGALKILGETQSRMREVRTDMSKKYRIDF